MKKKSSFWFTHDYGARNDPKMSAMQMEYGVSGIGVYWVVVEMMYEQGGSLPLSHIQSIAHSHKCDIGLVDAVVKNFGLFKIKGEKFISSAVTKRLNERKKKSIVGSESAKKRWANERAKAMGTQSEPNAIKERTREDRKRKEIIIQYAFASDVFRGKYDDWVVYLKSRKKPPTEKTIELQQKFLKNYPEPEAIAIIDESIRNGWQGLFPPKNNANGKALNGNHQKLGTSAARIEAAKNF